MPLPMPCIPKKKTSRVVTSRIKRLATTNNFRRGRSRLQLGAERLEKDLPLPPDSNGGPSLVHGSKSSIQAEEKSGDSTQDDGSDRHMGNNSENFQHMNQIVAALKNDPRHSFSMVNMPFKISIHKPGMVIKLVKEDRSIYDNIDVDKFDRPDFTYEPEQIIKAVRVLGAMLFQIKWKNVQVTDMVPLKIVKKKWPSFLLKFYEKYLNMSILNMHDI